MTSDSIGNAINQFVLYDFSPKPGERLVERRQRFEVQNTSVNSLLCLVEFSHQRTFHRIVLLPLKLSSFLA
jgi:hypothetical protein